MRENCKPTALLRDRADETWSAMADFGGRPLREEVQSPDACRLNLAQHADAHVEPTEKSGK